MSLLLLLRLYVFSDNIMFLVKGIGPMSDEIIPQGFAQNENNRKDKQHVIRPDLLWSLCKGNYYFPLRYHVSNTYHLK